MHTMAESEREWAGHQFELASQGKSVNAIYRRQSRLWSPPMSGSRSWWS